MPYKISKNQNRVPDRKVRYQFFLNFEGNKYRQTFIYQKSVVQKFCREWERQITDGSIQFRDYLFFEILDKYLLYVKESKSKQSFENESRTVKLLKTFFKDMKLVEFKRFHVQNYITWRKKNPLAKNLKTVTIGTVNREIAVISCFFNYCKVSGFYNSVNPAFKTKLKEQDREIRLTVDQINELLEKAEKQGQGRGIYTVVLIALLTGLRRNEVFNLKWTDIDFENSLIHLRKEITKGDKRRVVPIRDDLKAHLTEKRKKYPFAENVFNEWQTVNKLIFEWKNLRQKLSFKKLPNGLQLHFHDLRHVYAQTCRDAGISLDDIQTFLGHSSIRTTESKYAQFGGRDAVSKVNQTTKIIPLQSVVKILRTKVGQ